MLTVKQLDKLSDVCFDLAKATFLAGIIVPAFSGGNILLFVKALATGTLLMYFGLRLIRLSEI